VDNPLVRVDPGLYIWTIATFLVLAWLLRKYAWQPLLKALDERQKTIASAVENARLAREQLERAQEQASQVLAQARTDAEAVLVQARADAGQFRQEQRAKAAAEAETITKNAERQIQRETAKAVDAIRREAVDLSVAMASKLIRRQVSAQDQEALLQESLKEIGRAGQ
jgi:F-type H+-transporting ATPase subunit b